MKRKERSYHKSFLDYQKFIVKHDNYHGMPDPKSNSGEIKWVATGKSDLGKRRKQWWLSKGAILKSKGITISEHAQLSPICLLNHPTKKKPCQTCGKEMFLEYVYPTKATLNKINLHFSCDFEKEDFLDVFEIINELSIDNKNCFNQFCKIFPSKETITSIDALHKNIKLNYVEKFSRMLSPGAMSNCPDRFDGFHSYNLCCRSKEDTGRHKANLNRYGEDRRAYENWADGDWKAASWLMKEFNKHGVSADHIGPISLGFAHRPVFQPMTRSQNSSKGNRMSHSDFQKLINDENKGEKVVSWHSLPIWNRLKSHVKDNHDAYELSKYMRRNMHYVLSVLSLLNQNGHDDFLVTLLNPEHAYYSIKFLGFSSEDGSYQRIDKIKGDKHQYKRNAVRYIRIAFEQLEAYKSKDNRRVQDLDEKQIEFAISMFEKNPNKDTLVDIFDTFAKEAEKDFISGLDLKINLVDK